MTWTAWGVVQRARRRSAIVDVAAESVDGWSRHLSSRNAAVLAYFGFLSVFPLLMVATTILGIVLSDRPDLRDRIIDSALAEIPVVGTQIRAEAGEIDGDVITVIIGVLIALWAATRAFAALQVAFDDVWEVPVTERRPMPVQRLKAVVGMVVVGSALTVTGALAGLAVSGALGRWGLNLAALGVNLVALVFMMRTMTAAAPSTAMVWRGALLSAVGFTLLQLLGSVIVRRFLVSASDVAGVFATVFALTAWINLLATVSLLGAELNAARHRLGNGRHAVDTVSLGTAGR